MNNSLKIALRLSGVLIAFAVVGCNYFETKAPKKDVARVKETYLTVDELAKAMPDDISSEDSVMFAHHYIDRWATKQLLFEGAKRNLPLQKQEEFEQMINDYRQELYTEAYKDLLIADKMDTTITEAKMRAYFNKHRQNFKLRENLVKLRFIKLRKDEGDSDKIKQQIKRFNEKDRQNLRDEALTSQAHLLNDSIWVKADKLVEEIPPFADKDQETFLKKDRYIDVSDSLSLYLVFIKDVRLKDDKAPMSYVKPLLKQVILNKRKLKFAKKLEKDITKDALENNKFEIYHEK